MNRIVFAGRAAPRGPWVYLGKDVERRAALERRLGPPRAVGAWLREEERRLRRPFLRWTAELGRGQEPARWWAGTLAWKDPAVSDLFLLCCYRALALRLLRETNVSVVVEDAWLFHQLRRESPEHCDERAPSLAARALALRALGMLRRLKWLSRALREKIRSNVAPARLPERPAIALYSYVLARSFTSDGRFTDHYLPGLAEELRGAGFPVRRIADGEAGFVREQARSGEFSQLLRYATLADIAAALRATPTPPRDVPFDGVSLGPLLEREHLHDLSRAGRCAFALLHRAARRLFSAAPWRALVLPWEAQPQERLLVLAARESGLRTVGVQHSTVPLLQLNFFGAADEADAAPETLIVSGRWAKRALEQDGPAGARVVIGGSRRYQALPPTPPGKDVLVALPIDPCAARQMLSALARSYPRGGEGFRFRVKAHPAEPLPRARWGLRAEPETRPFPEALAGCTLVVFTGSTAGLEALRAGRALLRYHPETLLDVDPCDMLSDAELPSCGDEDLRDKLEAARRGALRASPAAAEALAELFAPLSPQPWLEAVGAAATPSPTPPRTPPRNGANAGAAGERV